MPQLPSGRHVGLASEPIQELARTGNMQLKLGFYKGVKTPADMGPLICIYYFHPGENDSITGEPYLSGLMVSDIGTDKCDWPEEDIAAFNTWIQNPATQAYMQHAYDELKHIIETVKVVMPENLKGVMEADEFELLKYCFDKDPDLPDDNPGIKKVPLTPEQQSVLNKSREDDRLGRKPKRR